MQAAFKKIIEKLEEEKMSYFLTIANTGDEKLDCAYEHTGDALDKAIEIVKQEAEKYNDGWIPFVQREMTEDEKESFGDLNFMLDCQLPDEAYKQIRQGS